MNNEKKLRCLIVEDQKPAQRVLQRYISQLDHLELIDVCASAPEGVAVLHSKSVDLIFLDVHLPQMDGFAFLRALGAPPKVIVTTAYTEHAIEAFDLDVIDYLLKPISFERFCRAVARVGEPARPEPRESSAQFLFVKVEGDFVKIQSDDIVYISSDGNFLNIVLTNQRYHILGTLNEWESRLPHSTFQRIHRSYIINFKHAARAQRTYIETSVGRVPIGRAYQSELLKRLSAI